MLYYDIMTIINKVSVLLSILALTFSTTSRADEYIATDVTETPTLEVPMRACDPGPLASYRMPDRNDTTAEGFSATVMYTCMNEFCVINHLSAATNFFKTNMNFYGHRATNWLELANDIAGVKAISSNAVAQYSKNCFGDVYASVSCGKKSNMCFVSIAMTR